MLFAIARRLRRHSGRLVDRHKLLGRLQDLELGRKRVDDRDAVAVTHFTRCDRYRTLVDEHAPLGNQLSRFASLDFGTAYGDGLIEAHSLILSRGDGEGSPSRLRGGSFHFASL